jgi:L-threonylcarbamoyladenylate synthase
MHSRPSLARLDDSRHTLGGSVKVLSLEAPRALEETIHTVQHGGVIAFPTDTVYGIGASLKHPDALSRIYTIKGRDAAKPLPVLLSAIDRIDLVAEMPDTRVQALLREFWPGALTVALPAKPGMPSEIVHADGTVGVRIPDHSIALTICDRAGGALATTSANRSGEPRPDRWRTSRARSRMASTLCSTVASHRRASRPR